MTVAGVSYNAILAFLAAHGMPVNLSVVAACEILILSCAAYLVVHSKLTSADLSSLALGYFGLVAGVALSIANDRVFLDGIRNFAIIAAFTMLGIRTNARWVDRCFIILTAVVMLVLIVELVSVPTYVSLFKPASYYEATRGIQKFSLDKTGLFRNALGFQGRLSFNPFTSFRTSSIFLEQVSLANFAGVLTIYLLTRWPSLSVVRRFSFATSLVLIIMTNSTRTTTILALVSLVGYWLYPRLPSLALLVLAPLLLGIGFTVTYFLGDAYGDNIEGRLGLTMRNLRNLDLSAILGLRVNKAQDFMDSGYPYLITSATLFGAMAFWLFVSLIVPQRDGAGKRCAWSVALYLFTNLLIGGTAIFSLKIAAPLWLLVGSLRGRDAWLISNKAASFANRY